MAESKVEPDGDSVKGGIEARRKVAPKTAGPIFLGKSRCSRDSMYSIGKDLINFWRRLTI